MYGLKQEITNLQDGVLNENIYIRGGKAYIKTDEHEYMYDSGWNIKVNDKWVDLQGGIPSVGNIEFVDNDVFRALFELNEKSENN